MAIESGQLLLHYRLIEKIGEGGMGVVWKATDTKLDREVAIKILPEHLSADPDRLGRFEREAKLLASLNHQNIASIYGFERAGSVRFLAMEYVDGGDLARRLARSRLSVDEALDVALQLARALDSAHEKGVLHRDLKPANIQVKDDGRIKVLDFGLAKAFETDPAVSSNPAMSPTRTSAGSTQAGTILGTAAYMSPEQARGKELDKRTDIWSFGCVLYECLTSRSPFLGETITDTLASVVKTPPDWSALPAETPPRIRELLERCLEKEARNRLRDIGDARLELQRATAQEESFTDSGAMPAAAPNVGSARRGSAPWIAVAALVGALAGIGLWSALSGPGTAGGGSAATARFSIVFPEELESVDWLLSPNGDSLVYAGRAKGDSGAEWALYLRSFDDYSSRRVEGSDGIYQYGFSPDGNWLAFRAPVAPRATKTRLFKVPVDGSAPPLVLLDWQDDWEDTFLWLPDGDLIVSTLAGESLVRIPSGGGAPRDPVKVQLDRSGVSYSLSSTNLTVLPDGHHILVNVQEYSQRGYDSHVGLIDVNTGETSVVVENGRSPAWLASGHLVFTRGDAVLAVAFDPDGLQTTGDTVAVEAGFRSLAGWGDSHFHLSANGTLLHWPGGIFGNQRKVVIADFVDGRLQVVEPWSEELRQYEVRPKVSPDGRRLAIGVTDDAGTYDIWTSEMAQPRLRRFIDQQGWDCAPDSWTRDGESLIYQCQTRAENTVYLARLDESEEPRQLVSARWPESYRASTTLPDDSAVVLNHTVGEETHLELFPLDSGDPAATPQRWLDNARDPSISPDGRWLAYRSDVSGRAEVYLRAIGPDRSLGREIPVTTRGGHNPWWDPRRRSSPLRLWLTAERKDFTVDVVTEPELRLSQPTLLGDSHEALSQFVSAEHLPDGRYLLVLKGEEETPPDRVNVILNWTAELQRKLGR